MTAAHFTLTGEQLLTNVLTELHSDILKDVRVECGDGGCELPRLFVAALSPMLAACLAQVQEPPTILLPHNTTQQIRMLVSHVVSGGQSLIPSSFPHIFHWVDFARERKWSIAGITSGRQKVPYPTAPEAEECSARDYEGQEACQESCSQFAHHRVRRKRSGSALRRKKGISAKNSGEVNNAKNDSEGIDVKNDGKANDVKNEGMDAVANNSTLNIISRNIGLPIQLDEATADSQLVDVASTTWSCSLQESGSCPAPAAEEGESLPSQENSCSQCSECGKVLYDKHCLKRHEAAVHRKLRPFLCSQCSKAFSCRSDLASHIATVHQRLKRWVCEECGSALSTLKALQAHRLIHAGPATKLQACHLCQQSFRHRSTLVKHVARVHKYEESHQLTCSLCSPPRSFRHAEGLKRHQRKLHSAQKDHRCEDCPAAFAFNYDLTRHRRRLHPQKSVEESSSKMEEGETVFVCLPEAAALLLPPEDGEADILRFTVRQPAIATTATSQPGDDGVVLEQFSQYQTVEIQGMSYNSILGQ